MAKAKEKSEGLFGDILGNHAIMKVLGFMMKKPDSDFSISQIAKGAGIGRTTLFRIFDTLEGFSIIKKTRVIGNAKLYALNIGNPFVKKLLDLYASIYASLAEEDVKGVKKARL